MKSISKAPTASGDTMETARKGILTLEAQLVYVKHIHDYTTNKPTQPAKTGQELEPAYSLNKYMGQ